MILSCKRSTKSGEDRLHDIYSIGFGGHCDLEDYILEQLGIISLHEITVLSAERELYEELDLPITGPQELKPIGVIKIDDTEVDRVYIGCVMVLESDVGLNDGEVDQ
jgi:predicted NUDIX family phosphoesterase